MNIRLRAKIALIIVAILFVALGANTFLNSRMFIEEYTEALNSRAGLIGNTLRSQLLRILELGIPLDELVGFEDQCREAVQTYGLSYAMVVDRSGRILFHNDRSQQGRKISSDALLKTFRGPGETAYLDSEGGKDYYNIVLPVFGPAAEHVAAVEVGFPAEVILKKRWPIIGHAAVVAGVFFLFAVSVIFLSLSRWVTRPLGRLVSVVEEIRRDNFNLNKEAEIHSGDEIGELGRTFNEMLAALRKSRAEVKDYTQYLEQRVAERTRELENAQKELVNKAFDAGRAQFSAMILHNIGNAVTPVRVHMEVMKEDNLPQLSLYIQRSFLDLKEHAGEIQQYIHEDPKGTEVFSFMGRAVDAMKAGVKARDEAIQKFEKVLTYISDILTLQQRYAAKEMSISELADGNVLIEDALQMQAGALDKRDIRVRKDLMRGLPKILIDKSRLVQVLVNLIKNAYEAIEEVSGEGKERVLTLRSYREEEYVCIELEDNGIGIKPEHLAAAFRFGESRKGSSGMGLYYCHMFLEASGGALNISSEGRGKGTSVLVRLPLSRMGRTEENPGKEQTNTAHG
jgi:signal transduction histidine kinase